MSASTLIKAPIKEELEAFEPYFKGQLKSNTPLLNIIIRYLLKTKGKQMRPMLVFLSAKLNGTVTQSTYNAASLVELMHTATLVHDDVVDDSNMRRGFFSINALWKNKVAVLFGDFLLAKGLLLAVNQGEFQQLKIVSKAVEDMSEGELLQIEKARRLDITEDVYFEIIRKKTAALMVACAAAGAKSVGAPDEVCHKMGLFGEYLGIAFQIRDDLFDYEASGALFGKPAANDIKERKMTLPFIYALTQCEAREKRHIIGLMRKKTKSADTIAEIIAFVKSHHGIEYAQTLMSQYQQKARDILGQLPQNEANNALLQLVDYTAHRKK